MTITITITITIVYYMKYSKHCEEATWSDLLYIQLVHFAAVVAHSSLLPVSSFETINPSSVSKVALSSISLLEAIL